MTELSLSVVSTLLKVGVVVAFIWLTFFAYRATDPQEMMSQEDPIGPDNDAYLNQLATESQKLIACWGK